FEKLRFQFEAEIGCKGKTFFCNLQIFQELFANFFLSFFFEAAARLSVRNSLLRFVRTCFLIADAKVGIILRRANFFEYFFHIFYKIPHFTHLYLYLYYI
ncbi:MAG: hypothetical protein J6J91_06515, partial [Alistipes sp.]|nr:hypothetical protein [Alistipes sp.]